MGLAYGHDRMPQGVIDYLIRLWQQRDVPRTDGARYFALTVRRAFFVMALRLSEHPSFTQILTDADRELRDRIFSDGLFVSWQIDPEQRGLTGDEFSTAMGILAYGLTVRMRTDIPPEIRHSAESLQTRIEGSAPQNIGVRKFYLAAVTTALEKEHVTRRVKHLVNANRPRQHSRDQDALYYWDYWYQGLDGTMSRRDYFHVPSNAVDILLACGSTAEPAHKLAALDLAEEDTNAVLEFRAIFCRSRARDQ